MVDERVQVPLSPPNSPRMSDAVATKGDCEYGPQQPQSAPSDLRAGYRPYPQGPPKPLLRSYTSVPYSKGTSSQFGNEGSRNESSATGASGYDGRYNSTDLQIASTGELPVDPYGASTPTSPAGRLTPRSPASARDQLDDDDLVDFGGEDAEEEIEDRPMTAAELRAHKRKMKRFRLTHNQTRFLMSEFARQAHPDAAHRERLAREIPGLSARQVQVWFQNRRAKLKRLTSDDRERMMRSRALPADFDTTQALHSPFGGQPPTLGGPMSAMGAYPPYSDHSAYSQQYASPTGMSPALGAFAFTPSQTASKHLSPDPAAGHMLPYGFPHQGPYGATRTPAGGLPPTTHAGFAGQPHLDRGPVHERLQRSMGESAGSPLRTSVSYSTLHNASAQPRHLPERAASFSAHSSNQQRPQVHNIHNPLVHSVSEAGPYGLGFSYAQVPTYQRPEPRPHQSSGDNVPHAMNIDEYRRPGHSPSTAYSAYPPTPYSTAQVPPYSACSTDYPSQNFSGAYAQQGQVTEPVSQAAQHMQQLHHGYQTASGPQQPYMQIGASNHHPVTDAQSHASGY